MKIAYDYFKDPAVATLREQQLLQYVLKKDEEAQALEPGTILKTRERALVATPYGFFRIGSGNSKVFFPTINFESGLSCSSQDSCPFAFGNKRADPRSKRPICYAQKIEGAYPEAFLAKAYQAVVCDRIASTASLKETRLYSRKVAEATKSFLSKFVRLSEVGDIGPLVQPLAARVIQELVAAGMRPYLYTKRPERERKVLHLAGAVVLVSEQDFVCVKTEEDAAALGMPVCPGECGGPVHKCYRCPLGKKTAVIAH